MSRLVFFLEERSAKELLQKLLVAILPPDLFVQYVVFEGKQDMENQLPKKLRGWMTPDTFFVILRDQDSEDCHRVKKVLSDICFQAGKPEVLIRIACRELESWYFGDLEAVEKGLGVTGLSGKGKKSKYRMPDDISRPARELREITNKKYQKISGSRGIGDYMNPDRNRSKSFRVFVDGVRRLAEQAVAGHKPQPPV